jgi:hypothetical protein
MGLILLSLFVQIAASLVYEFGFYLPGLDLIPISFSISALLLSINISRYHFLISYPLHVTGSSKKWALESPSWTCKTA